VAEGGLRMDVVCFCSFEGCAFGLYLFLKVDFYGDVLVVGLSIEGALLRG
jgi:hypothetical protein